MPRIAPFLLLVAVLGVGLFVALLQRSTDDRGPTGTSAVVEDVVGTRPIAVESGEPRSAGEPQAAPVRPTSERTASGAASTPADVRVVDPGGEPLAGVDVVGVTWERRFWARGVLGHHMDLEALLGAQRVGSSDVRGGVALGLDALEASPFGQVVWATAPGRRTAATLFEDASREGPFELVLEAAPSARVQVVDAAGRAVPAEVDVLLPIAPARPWSAVPPAAHACATFARRLETESNGSLALGAPPADCVEDRWLVRARTSDGVSRWGRVGPGQQVRLELGPRFAVAGRVEGIDELIALNDELASVLVEVEGPDGWRVLGASAIRIDGSFGPEWLPFVEGACCRARLDTVVAESDLQPVDARRGAVSELALRARVGAFVGVHVIPAEEPDGRVGEARVTASAETPVGRLELPGARADGDPLHVFRDFPEGSTITVRAEAPGRVTAVRRGLRVPEDVSEEVVLTLPRAGALNGTIRGAEGRTVTLVFVETQVGNDQWSVAVACDAEGAFTTSERPVRDLWVVPRLAEGEWGAPRFLTADRTTLDLDLTALRRCELLGVESGSGAPIEGAEVVLHLVERGFTHGAVLQTGVVTEGDGRAGLTIVPPQVEGAHLVASLRSADHGQSASQALVEGLTRFELERADPCRVWLESWDGGRLERTQLVLDGPTPFDLRTLADDGAVDLAGLADGRYALITRGRADVVTELEFQVPPGLPHDARIPLGGPCVLEVDVRGRAPGDEIQVLVLHEREGYRHLTHEPYPVELAAPRLSRIPYGRASAYVQELPSGRVLASRAVEFTPEQPHVVWSVDLTPSGWDLVVVDADDLPVAGADLIVTESASLQLVGRVRTDAGGRARITHPTLTEAPCRVSVVAADGRALVDHALPSAVLLDGSSEVVRVVLDPEASLDVRAVDPNGTPVAATIRITDWSEILTLSPAQSVDAAGRLSIDGLPAGELKWFARADGHMPEWGRIQVGAGRTPHVVELTPVASFALRVVDGAGEPLVGVRAVIRRPGRDEHPLGTFADREIVSQPSGFATGADGWLRFVGLPLAELALELQGPNGARELRLSAERGSEQVVEMDASGG